MALSSSASHPNRPLRMSTTKRGSRNSCIVTLRLSQLQRSTTVSLGLIPICRELRTPAGPIDVLYATPHARITIFEAKLLGTGHGRQPRGKAFRNRSLHAGQLCRPTHDIEVLGEAGSHQHVLEGHPL